MPKTITALFGLLLNMTGMLYAQQNTGAAQSPEDELFGLSRYSINYAWHIDLGKGNYLELELTDLSQLSGFQNMDSLLLVFLTDMKGFRDSLADPAAFKCIDYLVDTSGRKMVRIRQTKPASPAWLLGDEAPSLLRLQQDTVHLLLPAPPVRGTTHLRRNRLTLVINQYDELENLVTTGLNAKMRELGPMDNRDWAPKNGKPTLIRDPAISAKTATNYSAGHVRNYRCDLRRTELQKLFYSFGGSRRHHRFANRRARASDRPPLGAALLFFCRRARSPSNLSERPPCIQLRL
jgi:hypothetical protein